MTTIGVDPRIRARRIAVRRAEGRKRLRFLGVAVALVALAVAAWALSRSALLDLDHVRIEGLSGSEMAAVENAVGLEPGTPLFALDLGAVDTAVEALPWVATADVRRDWPGTVMVQVETRVAVAEVGVDGAERLAIDAEGVLTGPASASSTLPVIRLEPSAELGEIDTEALGAIGVARALPADLRPWVEAVTINPEPGADGRPIVGLDLIGGAVVELGSAELIDDKLSALRAILENVSLACITVIDVKVADLDTVTRDPACSGQPIDPQAGGGE